MDGDFWCGDARRARFCGWRFSGCSRLAASLLKNALRYSLHRAAGVCLQQLKVTSTIVVHSTLMIDKILPGFAALDLGATKIFAACADFPVRSFGTVTAELRALSAWLKQQGVQAVAMEATGVYWIPVHDQLQAAGFKVTLFHGAHARNLPGRKSDVSDCQWHAMLHPESFRDCVPALSQQNRSVNCAVFTA